MNQFKAHSPPRGVGASMLKQFDRVSSGFLGREKKRDLFFLIARTRKGDQQISVRVLPKLFPL